MLNIEDLENYDQIDYIRNSYGMVYAEEKGFDPKNLQDKLISDKMLVSKISEYKEFDPIGTQQIFRQVTEIKEIEESFKFREWNYSKTFSRSSVILRIIMGIILFPVFILSLFPNIFIYLAPNLITRKIKDHMFDGSIYYGLSVLLTIPLFYIITFVLVLNLTNTLWMPLVHVFALPFLGLFAWKYKIGFIKLKSELRYNRLNKRGDLNRLIILRESLFSQMQKIISFEKSDEIGRAHV